MAGYHTYADEDLINEDTMNDFIRDQVVTIFASTAARDAAIASPQPGQVCAVAPTGDATTLYVFNDSTSAWGVVNSSGATPPGFTVKGGNTARNTTTTVAVDPDLTIVLNGADGTWFD